MTRRLEEMRVAALDRFASMRVSFDKLRKAFEKSGYGSAAYRKAQQALSDQLMSDALHRQDDRQAVRHAAFAGR